MEVIELLKHTEIELSQGYALNNEKLLQFDWKQKEKSLRNKAPCFHEILRTVLNPKQKKKTNSLSRNWWQLQQYYYMVDLRDKINYNTFLDWFWISAAWQKRYFFVKNIFCVHGVSCMPISISSFLAFTFLYDKKLYCKNSKLTRDSGVQILVLCVMISTILTECNLCFFTDFVTGNTNYSWSRNSNINYAHSEEEKAVGCTTREKNSKSGNWLCKTCRNKIWCWNAKK